MAKGVTESGERSEADSSGEAVDEALRWSAIEAACSAWPVVEAWFPTEEAATEAADACMPSAAALGVAATQVELLEPADDGPGERWGLRYVVPGLDGEALVALHGWLRARAVEVRLGTAGSPGMQAAVDEGLFEEFEFFGVHTRGVTWAAVADGCPRRVDVFRGSRGIDAAWLELEHRVASAFARHGLGLESDRGADTLQPVVEAFSGNLGFELTCVSDGAEEASAARILAALDAVVAPPGDRAALRVARTFIFQPGLSWQVVGSLLAPPTWVPRLSLGSTLHFEPRARREPHVAEFELLVAPPLGVDESTWYAALAMESGTQVCSPASPRWVSVAGRPRCLARWRIHPSELNQFDREVLLDAGPAVVLLVPGAPSGLEERWSVCEPEWYAGRSRCVMRIRDAAQNIDLLPLFQQGTSDDWSTRVVDAIGHAVPELTEEDRREIRDPGGRRGVAVAIPATSLRAEGFEELLSALSDTELEAVSPVAYAGWHRGKFLVTLWETLDLRPEVPMEPRAWGGASSAG